jgi:DNA-binding CsgD family transcriptional regulator
MVESIKQDVILTERELIVLKLIAEGYSTKRISSILKISFNTVETHRKNILIKLHVKNCTEAVYRVTKLDII